MNPFLLLDIRPMGAYSMTTNIVKFMWFRMTRPKQIRLVIKH